MALAKMIRTVEDPHGYGKAVMGRTYRVELVGDEQVVLLVPHRSSKVPESFVVDLADVELMETS